MTRERQHPLGLCKECDLRFLPANMLSWNLTFGADPGFLSFLWVVFLSNWLKESFFPLWGFRQNLSFFKILCIFSHIYLCCDYFSQTTSLWLLPFGQNGEADLFEQEPPLEYYIAKINYPYIYLCICVSYMYVCVHRHVHTHAHTDP